ncbi:MAG: VOC family protein [Halieaceae bacterium]|jgi:catechol 2,3-dioxygenase-like lactoylglutathione lyase family enzyme|nr:VOC family protein [Halieaceae bacterium]
MVSGFDRIVIAVPALAGATADYRQLLGIEPVEVSTSGESPRVWFLLANTVVELVEAPLDRAAIEGIVFASASAGPGETPVANRRELHLRLCDGRRTATVRQQCGDIASAQMQVDHLVLRTGDATDCIALFGHQLGIRLALDKTVPEWGGRMLFFRAGKLTLEVIEPSGGQAAADYFWGIAYQCADLEQLAAQLAARGVKLSEVRAGRKPGSRVATVKSHGLGIPTLLIESAASAPGGALKP